MAQVLASSSLGSLSLAEAVLPAVSESRHSESIEGNVGSWQARCGGLSSRSGAPVPPLKSRRLVKHSLQSPEQLAVAAGASSRRRVCRPVAVVASLAEREAAVAQVRHPESRTGGSAVVYTARILTVRKRNPDFLGDVLKSRFQAVVDEIGEWQDAVKDLVRDTLGKRVVLALVSEEIDPKTGVGKQSQPAFITDWVEKAWVTSGTDVEYSAELTVDRNFGPPGAVTVVNNHGEDVYIKSISLTESGTSRVIYFPCHSFVDPFKDVQEQRVFFRNKAYLPGDTPPGLVHLRETQLASKRGDGTGMRKTTDRIFDYDVYNDYGGDEELARPVLGGSSELPYPRRCRTGRPPSAKDATKESRQEGDVYVPRDQAFEDMKQSDFVTGNLKNLIQQFLPTYFTQDTDTPVEFDTFDDIDDLYKYADKKSRPVFREGLFGWLSNVLGGVFTIQGEKVMSSWLEYPSPRILEGDKFRWMRDDEYGRQALAGLNPVVVERLKVFPPQSGLDPSVYGRRESALTEQHLEKSLEGLTVQEAIEQKRLFVIDHHDAFLPFVNDINSQSNRKAYAPRAVFFYDSLGVLKPVAIELSLPPPEAGTEGSKRVFTPGTDATSSWLWLMAKTHVSSVDAGIHQLSSHWLRTHACTEPYIIATHRHLSDLHPIAKLLLPHLRYTLAINGAARQRLIAAGGVIEKTFVPGPYAFRISSALYKANWRFDMEGLPADLIRRGMAEDTPDGPKLVIQDYPYAADGLLIWDALKSWVTEYVSLYYADAGAVAGDTELQAWWTEVRTVGHADKQSEPWWPDARSKESLADILTTIMWVASAQHAAVNFGQYAYSGYVPNKPTLTRRLIPLGQQQPQQQQQQARAAADEYAEFLAAPEKFFLSVLPNQAEAIALMSTVSLLATHSRDEEYIGERRAGWTDDERAVRAFERFAAAVRGVEAEIDRRNRDPALKLRTGAGVIPYEILQPRSLVRDSEGVQRVAPGITSRGVPNSVSI